MRIRITFSKTDAMRYTGHLDLHQAWERTFRRAGLPLAYTQGFSPHPRLNLASALPLGFTGQAELLDAWLEKELPLDQVTELLRKASPPGISIQEIHVIEVQLPALQTLVQANQYTITFLDPVEHLDQGVQKLMAAEKLPRRRRDKDYDLRPLIFSLQPLPPDESGRQVLSTSLSASEGATGRPEEILEVLGIPPSSARFHRTRILLRE